ncbi:MAG: hypothetical protein F4X44_08690 [Gammaproteobacteria bacterium]|nr:hypothetical protein [Gammaproteobacteria bacterium]MYD80675.1 hypothetical protein [Gammaproteobacteria bacterium]
MKQTAKSSLLLLAGISIGIGLTVAILAGYSFLSERNNTNSAQLVGESATSQRPAELSLGASESAQASDPQAIAELSSSFARKTALFALLADADVRELLEILKNSNEISPASRRGEIQSAVFQKLALIDPEIALREVQKKPRLEQDPLWHSLFEEWSSTNLETAIAQAESLRGSQRETALSAILHSRDDLAEDQRLQLAKQLGNENLAKTLIANQKIFEHTGSPSEKWKFIVNDGVDNRDQLELLVQIAELWSVEIGWKVLSRIYEDYREDYRVYFTLIESLSKLDPQGALDFLSEVELEERELVGRVVVDTWAQTDPIAALNALQGFEPPRLRKSFVDGLAYVWARNDPVHLVENVNLLGQAERIRPLEDALGKIAESSPEEALRQLELLVDSIEDTSTITRRIVDVWSEQNPQAAVDWIMSNYNIEDPRRSSLLPDALGKLSLENPNKAMAIALEQPVLEDQSPPEYRIILEMSWNADADNTVAMLARVRPDPRSESRSNAFYFVGKALIRNDRPDDALKLALQLSEAERGAYYADITWAWAYDNPLQMFEYLEKLPNADVKSTFATALVATNEHLPILTKQQMEIVRNYVQDEPK